MERGGWWSVMVINLVRDGRRGWGPGPVVTSIISDGGSYPGVTGADI